MALALVHRRQRWLVALRKASSHAGELWEFPGGRIEGDETPEAAALRELREECGVLAVVERSLPPVTYDYVDRTVELLPFVCRWLAGEAAPLAATAVRWVGTAELRCLRMPEANAALLSGLRLVGGIA